ncbi:MAG: EAL domain-containing protein [Alphaproteobacteria bacterium]|nr:EAL domain-containing protein [Alphaproteobacteria bacterium]
MPDVTTVLSQSVKTGTRKTLKNPMTYVGAAVVGGVSLITSSFSWGYLTPFLIPLLVQAAIRVLAEYEYREMLAGHPTIPANDRPDLANITDIATLATIFQSLYDRGGPHLLIKIQINSASEVIRLSEADGLLAENNMIRMIDTIIQQNFGDGMIVKTSFNGFLVILAGDYDHHEARLLKFIDDNLPQQLTINNSVYSPRLLFGITPLCANFGKSYSRLEFALHKATLTAGRTYWYVTGDSSDFNDYRDNRVGLRTVRQAIDNAELGLFAQPIVGLGTRAQTTKYEILLRHYHTASDIDTPAAILRYADFNKVSRDIDLYVINLLCRNFHRLYPQDGREIDSISINLTGSSFASPRFAGLLNDIITDYHIPKEKIILEITETIANRNILQAIETMNKFNRMGFKMALDDIGVGSSNFHNLSRFPVDYYKIDRIYCEEILGNAETRRFVQLIIDIGKSRGKLIIAEGIPDSETLTMLTAMGVDFSQSFISGKPAEFIRAPGFDPKTIP